MMPSFGELQAAHEQVAAGHDPAGRLPIHVVEVDQGRCRKGCHLVTPLEVAERAQPDCRPDRRRRRLELRRDRIHALAHLGVRQRHAGDLPLRLPLTQFQKAVHDHRVRLNRQRLRPHDRCLRVCSRLSASDAGCRAAETEAGSRAADRAHDLRRGDLGHGCDPQQDGREPETSTDQPAWLVSRSSAGLNESDALLVGPHGSPHNAQIASSAKVTSLDFRPQALRGISGRARAVLWPPCAARATQSRRFGDVGPRKKRLTIALAQHPSTRRSWHRAYERPGALPWRATGLIPAQLDIRHLVRLALHETELAAHLQRRLVVDHDLDPRAAQAP